MKFGHYLRAWWRLSRVPFLPVGILPLTLGFFLAGRWGYTGPLGLYLLSVAAVTLIMWMAYYLGEWNDIEGDRLNQAFNRFSGGSRVFVMKWIPPWVSLLLGYGSLVGAVLIGLFIYFQYQTGPWTLPLGGIGIFFGFFYSSKPLRWSYRGWGEILIGFCYGWLPVATGFYLLTGFFSHQAFLLSIPISLSVFNVILINEFPDEEADLAVGKRNLVVRYGKERIGDFYIGASILAAFSLIKVILVAGKSTPLLFVASAFPILLTSRNLFRMMKGDFQSRQRLEILCRDTLLVNLSMGFILTVQQALELID